MAYAVPVATSTGGFGSLPNEFPSTHAPVVGYITPAHTVFSPRHTDIGVLGASASTYAAPFATATGGFNSLRRAHRLHLHLWWSTSRRHQQFMLHLRLSWCTLALAQAVSYAAQAQVLEYFAPASSAYAGLSAPAPQWYAAPRLS